MDKLTRSLRSAAVIAVCLAAFGSAFAADLKPFQLLAKQEFDKEMPATLKQLNDTCGSKIQVLMRFDTLPAGQGWEEMHPHTACQQALAGITSYICYDPAYKPALVKNLKAISCTYDGKKPCAETNCLLNEKGLSYDKGVLTFHMNVAWANVDVGVRDFMKKVLDRL
jgi:hypothetical protein